MKRIFLALVIAAMYIAPSYGKVTYLHSTPSGTIVAATDASGNPLWVKKYTPFGVESDGVGAVDDGGTNYGYATHELDTATGLVYAKARYYDPMVGRFYSVDPCKAGLTAYSYGQNNPFTYADPSGCVQSYSSLPLQGLRFMASVVGLAYSADVTTAGLAGSADPLTAPAGLGLTALGATSFVFSFNSMASSAWDLKNNLLNEDDPAPFFNLKSGFQSVFGEENGAEAFELTSFTYGLMTGNVTRTFTSAEPEAYEAYSKINESSEAGQSLWESGEKVYESFASGGESGGFGNDGYGDVGIKGPSSTMPGFSEPGFGSQSDFGSCDNFDSSFGMGGSMSFGGGYY